MCSSDLGVGLLPFVRVGQELDYWVDVLPGVLLFSVGLTLTVAPLTTTVLSDAGKENAGIASGINNAVARIAGLLGIAVVGLAVASSSNELTLGGFHAAMLITAVLVATGGAIGLIGIRNPRRS